MNRIVKKTLQNVKRQVDWESEKAKVLLGDPASEEGNPGRIRRFYTSAYKDLDVFDEEWYACFYDKRDQDWLINYLWSVIMTTVVNGRSAYNEDKGVREPMKVFARAIVSEIQDYAENM